MALLRGCWHGLKVGKSAQVHCPICSNTARVTWAATRPDVFLRELERATYLTRTRRQGTDGRWIWDYVFRPTSVLSTIDALSVGGSPVDGSTVDGKGVNIIHTLNNSRSDNSILNKTTTTTPAAKPIVVVADLVEVH